MTQVQRLLGFLRPYTLRFAVAILLMAVVGACEALMALLIRPVFDRVFVNAGSAPILLFEWPFTGRGVYLQDFMPRYIHNVWTVVAVAIIAVMLAKGIAEFLGTYFINFVGHSVVRDLRNLLYSRIIEQSMAFFGKNPTGKLMSAVTSDIEKVQNAVSQSSADFLREIFTLVFLMAVIFYLDWRLALISLFLVPFVIFPSSRIGRYIRTSSRHSPQTTGGFVAFVYALIKMYEPIKRLTGVNNAFQQAVGASEQVFGYLDVHSEIQDRPGAVALPPFRKEIVFERVSFDYEPGL